MSNIPSKEGNAVIDGKKLNPDFGKKVDIKKEFPDKKPEVSTMTKQGKPRTKAQMMAAKRIADGKSISDVKAANTASMKAKAAERNQKFQDAKKSGNLAQFRKDNPKMSGADRAKEMAKARLAKKAEMANEEFTPYDIVLEYLLSTEQVATIEEANYVMTEMDAKTIQGIVEEQKKNSIVEKTGVFKSDKLNKMYPDQPEMTDKGKKILPNLPDPTIVRGKKVIYKPKGTPRIFGDPTGKMSDFFKS